MNFEAKLAGFVYLDGTSGEGWPDYVTVDNGGILLSEYDTRTYYPIDRGALLALADEMGRVRIRCDFCIKKGGCDWADETICLENMMDSFARRIREACGEDGL